MRRVFTGFEACVRCVVPIVVRLPNDTDAQTARLPGTDPAVPTPIAPPPPF